MGHRDHAICNPTSDAKLDALVEILALPEGARVLDVGCGKAELLVRTARRWGCRGVGVDLSPRFMEEARARVEAAGLSEIVELVHADAAGFEAPADSFDAAICLGASWIFGGHAGTLEALARWARPDGLVVVGECFWRSHPPPRYLEATGLDAASFGSHEGNVRAGLERGLALLHTFVSSEHDFDRYEGLQWNAIERHAREHPEDADAPELVARLRRERDAYLRWGRQGLGWSIYVFAKGTHVLPE